jgi:propanediol dehydratase small subunit
MTDGEYADESEILAEITPDFILDVYDKAKASRGEQREILLKVAEVLSEHIGEYITSD